ncbi:hypothetical protein Tco_1158813 [Tanacetum coccineum]
MVLDDDCKETESGVSGMDGDNELVDYVRCDEAKLEVSDMGYVECCEENVNVRGNGIECVNLIALDELCGGKVEGIEIELDDLVDSNAVSTCRVVTNNFAKRDNVLEERNKRVGLSSLIYELPQGRLEQNFKTSRPQNTCNVGCERNEINVSSLVNECNVVMNSSKGDWTSNFNKPVDIIKECSVEQKEGRRENNKVILFLGVCLFGRCRDLKNVKGLIDKKKSCNKAANGFDVCNTNPESSIKSMWNWLFNDQKLASGFNANKIATTDVGMNLEKEVASDVTTVDVLDSESPELTKGGSITTHNFP